MDGLVVGRLENDFLKKSPSPKFGLESQIGTYDFGVCLNINYLMSVTSIYLKVKGILLKLF